MKCFNQNLFYGFLWNLDYTNNVHRCKLTFSLSMFLPALVKICKNMQQINKLIQDIHNVLSSLFTAYLYMLNPVDFQNNCNSFILMNSVVLNEIQVFVKKKKYYERQHQLSVDHLFHSLLQALGQVCHHSL